MSKYTPGRDEKGTYWFDCGCHINGVMSCRCPLHDSAPDLLAALRRLMAEGTVQGGIWRVDLSVNSKALTEARAAIQKAEQEAGE